MSSQLESEPFDQLAEPGPRRRVVVGVFAVFAVVATLLLRVAGPAAAAPGDTWTLFDDQIADDFGDWSWAQVDTTSTAEVASGSVAAAVDAGPWEAFYIGSNSSHALPLTGRLEFEVHGGGSASEIGARLLSSGLDLASVPVTPLPNEWTTVSIPLVDLGGPATMSGVWFDNLSADTRVTFHIDNVRIVEGAPPPAQDGPALTVDLTGGVLNRTVVDPATGESSVSTITFPHAISDDIYGMNFVTDEVREELDVPVNRWGGNSTERFNHTIGATNLGNDWFFMNSPDHDPGADHRFEEANQADGTDTILTLPMLGWVAKDESGTCSFPTNDALGATHRVDGQDASEPHYLDTAVQCGNGFIAGERVAGGADPTLTSVAVDERFAADWVRELVDQHGTAAAGGVESYALGNEPGLWYGTHADVRPDPIGRDELIDRNQTWASAVKAIDPTANVIGPVLWSGWSYYVTGDEVEAGLRPGDVPTFTAEYLRGMADASEAAGERLLDKLAINFYDDRVYGGGTDDLRLESTRNLWDPTYAPQDWWVTRDFTLGNGSAVIPRMQTLIDQHYPGTGLAITEYNFGGNDTIAGGLAQADALGIFGREGLDVATIWDPWAEWTGLTPAEWADRPVIDAFRLFRNYDGNGARFGDQAQFATSSDEGAVSVHAATRSTDGALTVLIINKARTDQNVPLTLVGATGDAERWDWSAATDMDIRQSGTVTLGDAEEPLALAARSATLLVLVDVDDSEDPGDPNQDPQNTAPTVSGHARLIEPVSLLDGGPHEGRHLNVVQEAGPTTLDSRLRVDRTEDGWFNGRAKDRAFIAAGTDVCSWYVHADSDRRRIRGTVSFGDAEVLGVIVRNRQLGRSADLAVAGVDYDGDGAERHDRFRLTRSSEGTSLWMNLRADRNVDGIRIITDCG